MEPYSGLQEPPSRQHRNGCFWGCIGTLIAVVVIIAAVFSYGAWYFYHGFSNDARIQVVMDTVRQDARATSVLGRNVRVLEIERHTFDYSTGRGGTATYVLKVAGSEGEGEIRADLDITGGGAKIKLLILTGKDGQSHYLVGTPPPNPLMQNSI